MTAQKMRGMLRGGSLAFLLAALTWMGVPAHPANAAVTILYVKSGASGANNGTSWTNAYTSVQSALDAAASGGYELWVAAGTYRPFRAFPPSASDTFQLHNNVAIYGGFAGTETQRSQRNWQTNVTTLSGHLTIGSIHYFAYHVVTGSGTNATAVLDGFTVTGGNANGPGEDTGGGMVTFSGSPAVSNVAFTGNSATGSGGGMAIYSSNATLTNVSFTLNSAPGGAGMYNFASSPILTYVTFSGNSATTWGGGIYNNSSSHPTLSNVAFTLNSANDGGGIYNQSSNPTFNSVTFSGNSATEFGGAMFNDHSSPMLTNVTFSRNSAKTWDGGGMSNAASSPTLTNITFNGNSAKSYGGGMYNSGGSNPKLTNIIFSGNSANSGGGGIYNYISSANLTNVTFSGNSAANHGGGILNNSSSLTMVNGILWGNTAPSAAQIYNENASSTTITYSDIQGGQGGFPGPGDIFSDPKFIRMPSQGADGTWGTSDDDYGDLHLQPGSPAIDAGNNAAVPGGVTTDRDANPRIMGKAVDMGAYEAFLKLFLPLIRK